MNDETLDSFSVHETKRKAVKLALRELQGVSLQFWRSLEGESAIHLHKQLLHLGALREEVITCAETLLEADAEIVGHKARANMKLREALSPTAGQEPAPTLELHQSPLLAVPGALSMFLALKAGATEADARAWTRMSRDWKMLLYSLRCAQDCIYGALLLSQKQPIGKHASMSTCFEMDRRGNPKANSLMLEKRVPGYGEWFRRMKGIRNELKRGLSVASEWSGGEHIIRLSELYPDGDFLSSKNVRTLSLDFAAECLRMCSEAIQAVHAELIESSQKAPHDEPSHDCATVDDAAQDIQCMEKDDDVF
jgi:hypothetical protein